MVRDRAMQKSRPERRYKTGLDFAADLTRVHQKLREAYSRSTSRSSSRRCAG